MSLVKSRSCSLWLRPTSCSIELIFPHSFQWFNHPLPLHVLAGCDFPPRDNISQSHEKTRRAMWLGFCQWSMSTSNVRNAKDIPFPFSLSPFRLARIQAFMEQPSWIQVDHILLDCYLKPLSSYLLKPLSFKGLLLQQLSLYPSLPMGWLGQDLFQRQFAIERVGRRRLSQSPRRILNAQTPERQLQTWVARCGIKIRRELRVRKLMDTGREWEHHA